MGSIRKVLKTIFGIADERFKEHDVIVSKQKLNSKIPKGTSGVILLSLPKNRFEVEFLDKNNETIYINGFGSISVSGDDIEAISTLDD